MCYVLYVASPLTLSEVRSMLPAGMSAHALAPDDDRRLRRDFRARTIVRLLIGPCSCDLILPRDVATHAEERELRLRYAAERLPRTDVIRALDVHRALPEFTEVEPPEYWRRALVEFVAEHARNAGPTVYWLRFAARGADESPPDPPTERTTVTVSDALRSPGGWLTEGNPIRVIR